MTSRFALAAGLAAAAAVLGVLLNAKLRTARGSSRLCSLTACVWAEFLGSDCLGYLTKGNPAGLAAPKRVVDLVSALRSWYVSRNAKVSAELKKDGSVVEFTSKESFVQKLRLEDRMLEEKFLPEMLHSSSGSSGKPTLWGRSAFDEIAISVYFEFMITKCFGIKPEDKTLCVICFPLGVWVGGLFTTLGLKFVSMKGMNLSIIAPGNKVDEIVQSLQVSVDQVKWDHVILFGYPPFLKAVLDDKFFASFQQSHSDSKSFWTEHFKSVRMVLAGEVFTEEWRSMIAKKLSIPLDQIQNHFSSMYGTADAAVIATETPLSIRIRRFLSTRPDLSKTLFGKDRLPTLCQYSPNLKFLELNQEMKTADADGDAAASTSFNGSLVITSIPFGFSKDPKLFHRILPTLRYEIKDDGGICNFQDLMRVLQDNGFDGSSSQDVTLPFVWVFGRKFWTLSMYGANVYVENIMPAIEQPEFAEQITGKFFVSLADDEEKENKRLAVIVELSKSLSSDTKRDSILPGLKESLGEAILFHLRRLNSEFRNYVPGEMQKPLVTLKEFGDAQYFPQGVKHKYI